MLGHIILFQVIALIYSKNIPSPPLVEKSTKSSLNFIFHGDWGWNSYNQSQTAYEMGVYAWLIKAEFVVALGDNFYENGVQSTTDSVWKSIFQDIYSSRFLNIPWYPVLGNHDYHGNVDAQVARSKVDKLWTMPDRYYAMSYNLTDGGILSIVYIDTCILNPEVMDTSSLLNDPGYKEKKKIHLDWIENALSKLSKTSTWLLVAGHYPVYSIGEHGDDSYLIQELLPLLQKYSVHAYLAGHDHSHQHIYKDGMNYFISGGSAGRPPLGPHGLQNFGKSEGTNYVKHYFLSSGFSFAEVDSTSLNVTFVDNFGRIRYTASLDNPSNVVPASLFGSSLPGLGVSSGAAGAIILVPAIAITAVIIFAFTRATYNPVNMVSIRDGSRIRLDVVDSSTHSSTSLNTPSLLLGTKKNTRRPEFHV